MSWQWQNNFFSQLLLRCFNKKAYDLEKRGYDAIGKMDMEADIGNCFIECDVRCDELGLSW